ncbi:type 1 glutamine amidotransferase [Candidatus Kaiserbacteria bacterium]|nr:type 1 glutamine amidotransferase [Candidatus Kaiserbacteria bacterium]
MGTRILVVQFRFDDKPILEQQPIERVLQNDGYEIVFKNALTSDINLTQPEKELAGFDAVILSGSADLYFDGGLATMHRGRVIASRIAEEARPFARHLIERNIPTLGICFGHQLLGFSAGASVGHSPVEGKTGTHVLELTEAGKKDPLMRGVAERFQAHYGHKDVLFDLPEGAIVLACGGETCSFSALKYSDNVYSVQFHPELSRDEIRTLIKSYPEYVPDESDIDALFDDAEEAEQVLRNFAALAARG